MREKLLISFSGGETSAYMLYWCLKKWSSKYEIKVVFANTGQENEETLIFVKKCSDYFNCDVVWVEAFVNPENKKGTTHKIVTFETASRNGEPFEDVIKKYGIPNQSTPHCNRELKLAPIKSYLKSIGWKKYFTAIGIRYDEIDRMNQHRIERRILYPLIQNQPMTKPKINFWWNQQPFRLGLKGYQGNCKACWKKSDSKLYTILNESPEYFEFVKRMEDKYSSYIPKTRIDLMDKNGKTKPIKTTFFRKNRDSKQLEIEAHNFKKNIIDDSQIIDYQIDLDIENSCDILSECGIDN